MKHTVLYSGFDFDEDGVERTVLGNDVRLLMRNVPLIADLDPEECRQADGLVVFRQWVSDADLGRFPNLRVIVRFGVGYDRLDRQAAARRGIMVCNVPDYGTNEVADHAIAMLLMLRRGILLHLDAQRRPDPANWSPILDPLIRRVDVQTLGVLGMGRIGTATALKAKALGFRVIFHDPFVANGYDRAVGIERVRDLDSFLARSGNLSIHTPLTAATRGMVNARALEKLPRGAVVINTARGAILDIEPLPALIRSGHIAGVGLDVIPVEPPVEPIPELLRAYRGGESWTHGRVVITPHVGFYSPEAHADTRLKAAETMWAALFSDRPENVVSPDEF